MLEQQRQEVRAKWSEDKLAKVSKLEAEHHKILEGLYRTLNARNSLLTKPLPESVLQIQCQALIATADLAALVDTLEGMGKIDRVDYMVRCVDRFKRMASLIERPS